ncbi:MAG: transglycosylase SLT domain-containing protein, partial [Chloroflexi bacterium]|nr:transglycosylase SLT domain-containing protein [Chloroflexota bacterium]
PTPTAIPRPTPTPSPTFTPTFTPSPPTDRCPARTCSLPDVLWMQDDETAEQMLRARLRTSGTPYMHVLLARIYLARGEGEKALEHLEQVTPQEAHLPEIHLWRARAYMTLGTWDQAEREFRAYAAQDLPLRGYAWAQLANLYETLGRVEEALDAHEKAVALAWPDQRFSRQWAWATYLEHLERWEDARARYQALLQDPLTPAQQARVHLALGTLYLRQGDNVKARQSLLAAVDAAVHTHGGREPARVEPAAIPYAYRALVILVDRGMPVDDYTRGVVDVEAGAYAPAVDVLIRYLDRTPHFGDAHAYLARALAALGSRDAAIQQWRTLIDTHPECPCWEDAWFTLASIYYAGGESYKAYALLRELESHPRSSPALAERAQRVRAEWALQEGDLERARERFTRLAYRAAQPDTRNRAALLAAVLSLPDDPQTAQDVLDHALALTPSPHWEPALTYWRGKSAVQGGDISRGKRIWRELAKKRPATFYAFRAADGLRDLGETIPVWEPRAARSPHLHGRWELSHQENIAQLLHKHALSPEVATLLRRAAACADGGLDMWALHWYTQAIDTMDDPSALVDLGYILQDLGYPHLGIRAAARGLAVTDESPAHASGEYWPLLYPLPARSYVEGIAREFGLDVDLLYALIRQESRFATHATSTANAQGLMQVIPSTARWAARGLGIHVENEREFYRPLLNLRLGAYYLATVLRQMEGNVTFALAGYNAGPGNAARWRDMYGVDEEHFIELIPVLETRIYLREVLRQQRVYRARLSSQDE